jgi:hypothetical protein
MAEGDRGATFLKAAAAGRVSNDAAALLCLYPSADQLCETRWTDFDKRDRFLAKSEARRVNIGKMGCFSKGHIFCGRHFFPNRRPKEENVEIVLEFVGFSWLLYR